MGAEGRGAVPGIIPSQWYLVSHLSMCVCVCVSCLSGYIITGYHLYAREENESQQASYFFVLFCFHIKDMHGIWSTLTVIEL